MEYLIGNSGTRQLYFDDQVWYCIVNTFNKFLVNKFRFPEECDFECGDILLLTGCVIINFGGVSLSIVRSS